MSSESRSRDSKIRFFKSPQASGSSMLVPYYQVDAFATRVFTGNPAGVCLLGDWLPDDVLQSIATENNLAETAFVVQRSGRYDLRWCTPKMEVDLCGHATLAPAHVIFEHLGFRGERICFDTRSGELSVMREGDLLVLDFPSRPAAPCPPPPNLIAGLGRPPVHVALARDYLAVFETEREVADLQPDMAALARLDSLGIIATAPGDKSDFVSRFFAPKAGIPEDPVTGSAHSTLIPYWSARLGKTRLFARQISPRGGELHCENRGARVGIGGRAVTYSTGFIRLSGTDSQAP
jgi:predicted PhzF superfamily epimerase YddE/YHI9